MEGIVWKKHKGNEIVVFDFAGKTIDQIVLIISEAKKQISAKPKESILALTDLSGMRFNSQITNAFKEFTAHNKPYIKASAIVGIEGLQKLAYNAVMSFSKRKIPIFQSHEQSMDWLVTQ
jgi:hypothetical protein